jgi:DNA-binding ferritin-like protein
MSEDIYYQRAEYLVTKGYLPKMEIEKVAEILKKLDFTPVESSSPAFVNSRSTVYGDFAPTIKQMVDNIPAIRKALISEIEKVHAQSNGNIRVEK